MVSRGFFLIFLDSCHIFSTYFHGRRRSGNFRLNPMLRFGMSIVITIVTSPGTLLPPGLPAADDVRVVCFAGFSVYVKVDK